MSYQSKAASYNLRVRVLLFFARPIYAFNVYFFFMIWKATSYGPSTFPKYWGNFSATEVTESLWQDNFSSYILYFVLAVVADVLVQEFLPLISGD